jgi:hypothetical protein
MKRVALIRLLHTMIELDLIGSKKYTKNKICHKKGVDELMIQFL